MLPNGFLSLWKPPILGSDRIGIFYFLWFLTLMRKARNVIIKLPKVANSVRIPMKKMETAQSPFPSTITSIYYIQAHHSYVLCKAHLQISADIISQFYPIIVLVIKLFS